MFNRSSQTADTSAGLAATGGSAGARKPDAADNRSRPDSRRSYIASDVSIRGQIRCESDLQFEGKILGDIESDSVTIGQGAAVDGVLRGNDVLINGAVSGQVEARNIRLGSNARITADVTYANLSIDAGAAFEGQLSRLPPDTGAESGAETDEAAAG